MRNQFLHYLVLLAVLLNQSRAFSADKGTQDKKLSSERESSSKTRYNEEPKHPLDPAPESKSGPGSFVVNKRGMIFDFEDYWEMMGPLDTKEEERLCGLDKYCIERWKHGKLRIYKEGHVFVHDFNEDGKPDEAFVLEKDNPKAPLGKEFLIYITSKEEDGHRFIVFHSLLPATRSVIETYWDDKNKALVIDTGGRIEKTELQVSQVGGQSFVNNDFRTVTTKVTISIVWNKKAKKFDVFTRGLPKKG